MFSGYKEANWNENNEFVIELSVITFCKSNVGLLVGLHYDRLYETLQDFSLSKIEHQVILAVWVENELFRLKENSTLCRTAKVRKANLP